MGKALSTKDNLQLLNYVMQQDPVLTENLDLPSQKDNVADYGKLIMNADRKKNAFINTINLIALTLIVAPEWENPWQDFTEQGRISYGSTVREMYVDIPEAKDYNDYMMNATNFLQFQIPNIYNYFHEINFQKWYKYTINDVELGLAFVSEEGIYRLIMKIRNNLYEAYKLDKYLIDKYMLQRRIIDGTIPSVQLENFDTNTPRQNVTLMKEQSNNMTFYSRNYNPAGVYKATPFRDQRLIMSTGFEAQVSTEVLATSYFKNEAEFKINGAMTDGFGHNDWTRLASLIGSSFVPFTDDEITKLNNVVGVIIEDGDREKSFYKDFYYALDNTADTKETEFYNPEALMKNIWLHSWRIMSTSPFANCLCFTKQASGVTSVAVSPSTATVSKGQDLKLSSTVTTTGITNKSVMWSIPEGVETLGAKILQDGTLRIPSSYSGSNGTQGVYTLTVSTALANGDSLTINGIKYDYSSTATTTTAQATAIYNLVKDNPLVSRYYTVTNSSNGVVTFTEKSGYYGTGKPTVDDDGLTTGVVTEATTTSGVASTNVFPVTATSIYDNTKDADAVITIA
jgi:hypothetical protein